MREILFRGKRTNNGEWVEGFYSQIVECVLPPYKGELYGKLVTLENRHKYLIRETIRTLTNALCDVIPETVGQFTGLYDKNGKKIFEGDIVRADDYIFSIKYGKCGGTPNTYNYGYMGFYLEAASEGTKLCAIYGLRDDICYFTDISVIGNIYDNPELLA
jgi:uncharacterized phage protein (TIGR01671 family)